MEWGRATKSSRCDQRSSEAGLELACHRRSSCHDLSFVDSTSGTAQRIVTHTGWNEGQKWLSTSIVQCKFKVCGCWSPSLLIGWNAFQNLIPLSKTKSNLSYLTWYFYVFMDHFGLSKKPIFQSPHDKSFRKLLFSHTKFVTPTWTN